MDKLNDVPYLKDKAWVYNGALDKIREAYPNDKAFAGEIAIAAIEHALTGQMSTDNWLIKAMLADTARVNDKNQELYVKTCAYNKQKDIEELRPIARLYAQGYTQKDIGTAFNLSQQAISKKIIKIKQEYPELLEEYNSCTTSTNKITNGTTCTTNTTSTTCTTIDKDKDKDKDKGTVGVRCASTPITSDQAAAPLFTF